MQMVREREAAQQGELGATVICCNNNFINKKISSRPRIFLCHCSFFNNNVLQKFAHFEKKEIVCIHKFIQGGINYVYLIFNILIF